MSSIRSRGDQRSSGSDVLHDAVGVVIVPAWRGSRTCSERAGRGRRADDRRAGNGALGARGFGPLSTAGGCRRGLAGSHRCSYCYLASRTTRWATCIPTRRASLRWTGVRELHAGVPRGGVAGRARPSPGAALDRHGDHDARDRSARVRPARQAVEAVWKYLVPRRSDRVHAAGHVPARPRSRAARRPVDRSCWTT